MFKGGNNLMKTKLLLRSAVLFFFLGLNARDSALYYFFSIHLFMLFIGVHLHKLTQKLQPEKKIEPLPETSE